MPLRLLLLILAGLVISEAAFAGVRAKSSMKRPVEPIKTSLWSALVNYGVSTDLADEGMPRLYYQGVTASASRMLTPRLSLSLGLSATFTTLNGQIDKGQEQNELESSGVSPNLGLSYSATEFSPWFFSFGGSALLDSASQRESYLGVVSANGGGSWKFWQDRYVMTHSLGVMEIMNAYEYSSQGTPNPGTSLTYAWANAFGLTTNMTFSAGFGLKRTRYLDGFWDYSYNTFISLAYAVNNWSASIATSNGGYTDDGRISLWYIDQYRRIVSLSLGYTF